MVARTTCITKVTHDGNTEKEIGKGLVLCVFNTPCVRMRMRRVLSWETDPVSVLGTEACQVGHYFPRDFLGRKHC